MARTEREPTGWIGWIYFASLMMVILGGLQAIVGLVALLHHSFYVATQQGLVVWNLHTWGWIDIILGIVVALTGMALASGRGWARFLGGLIVVINAFAILTFLPLYPLWGIIGLIVSALVIYAITVHGHETTDDYYVDPRGRPRSG